MEHGFKREQINHQIIQALHESPATAYFAAMLFQLGCSIGELVGMGVTADELALICDESIEKAVRSRQVAVVNEDVNQ